MKNSWRYLTLFFSRSVFATRWALHSSSGLGAAVPPVLSGHVVAQVWRRAVEVAGGREAGGGPRTPRSDAGPGGALGGLAQTAQRAAGVWALSSVQCAAAEQHCLSQCQPRQLVSPAQGSASRPLATPTPD